MNYAKVLYDIRANYKSLIIGEPVREGFEPSVLHSLLQLPILPMKMDVAKCA